MPFYCAPACRSLRARCHGREGWELRGIGLHQRHAAARFRASPARVSFEKENVSVSLSGTFNSASAGESRFAIMGNEGALVFRNDTMTFTQEHVVEGNDWIVTSWPSELEKAYWANPEVLKKERPATLDFERDLLKKAGSS